MIRSAAVVLLLVLLLAGPVAGAESIRVGYLGPLTGIFAAAGKDMLDGLKMAFEQMNYEVAGRKIELIEEDDEGNPATAQAKYRKLVAQYHIHVLTGVLLQHRVCARSQHRARPAAVPVSHHAGRAHQAPAREISVALQLRGEPTHARARRLRGQDAQVPARRGHRDGQQLRP